MENPRVIDNDRDEITVELNGRELRGWSYKNYDEQKLKMKCAREYVEGWCTGRDHVLALSNPHIHVAGTTAGKHIDECAKCGRDIRDPIHARA
jgi:hypothetical protein